MEPIKILTDYLREHYKDELKTAYDVQEHFDNISKLLLECDLPKQTLTEKNLELFEDIKICSDGIEPKYYQDVCYKGFVERFDEITIHEIFAKILVLFHKIERLEDSALYDMNTFEFLAHSHQEVKEEFMDIEERESYIFYRRILHHKFQLLDNKDIWYNTVRFGYELMERIHKLDDVQDIVMVNCDTIFYHRTDNEDNLIIDKANEYLDGLFTFDYYKTYTGIIDKVDKYFFYEFEKGKIMAMAGYERDVYTPNKHVFNSIFRKHYKNDIDYEDYTGLIKKKDPDLVEKYKAHLRKQKLERILNDRRKILENSR